ncbi:MAG TPA: hypothetical protein VEO00_08530, partial [Actinomycetota bacterium]|nr:hypothetical protein [Actinomycetota bacterium]
MLTREAGHRVRRIQSDAFPVLSVCLSLSPLPRDLASVRPRLKDLLDLIRAAADPERLGHEAAMSVRADVERVLELEDRIHADVGHGVAVFACHGLGPFEYLSLPRGLPDRASLDGRAQTGPLDAFLERSHRCVAVVVERDRSSIFEFHQGELEVHREVRDGRIRKRNYGGRAGLDEYTVTRHAREEALRHHRRTVRAVGQLFSPRGSARRTRSSRA